MRFRRIKQLDKRSVMFITLGALPKLQEEENYLYIKTVTRLKVKLLKKEFRIKKNNDFQAVFQNGRSFANRQFVVYSLPKENQAYFRIGLSVSKKLGNAVTRNRIKRFIRQSILELRDQITTGNDYVIIARKPAADMDFFEVKSSLTHVLKVGKVLKRANR